ncbi:MAG TPA: D-alanyl-D-alanine carboxypeptidase [Cyclobacteriaceae bacterium]|nr:D-alanyl-D-alanine carboxypeptidase [Cyclobacteriaceae bacterium]HRJ80410.1 D-alanyl-D-alanine carboxypeptidase [Cyclobacteriaceae bacterium]
MKIRFIIFVVLAALMGCSPLSKSKLNKSFTETERKFQDHIGFVLYDPEKKETVYTYNGEKYFTPASNTKIFTLFSSLALLGDSLPALNYMIKGDSLIFSGTGDPSFLYDQVYNNKRTIDFLKTTAKELYYAGDNFFTSSLGPGWAWSDYNYAYSAERSPFPIYGNTYKVTQPTAAGIRVTPTYFKKYFWLADSLSQASSFVREVGSNRTDYFPGKLIGNGREWYIPFKSNALLVTDLLADTLKRPVYLLNRPVEWKEKKTLYSVPADSVYKVMMQESDNFLAEQLLLVCSGVISDTLQQEIAIKHIIKIHLFDLPDSPVWVDGSGLSRYNLFTPRSIVALWDKLYTSFDRDRLFSLLAVGGKSGTLRNNYKHEPPYVYGKTGTLRNNHSLSGYLITKKGRTLIFSYMNNNYTVPVADVRSEMERLLKQIYEKY